MLLLCIIFCGAGVLHWYRGSETPYWLAGALASTINIIVLDNPMTFHFSQFLDSALGQLVVCFLAMMVQILLVRITLRREPAVCC